MFRCTVRTECTDHLAEGKHLPDDLDDLIPLAHTQLENWRAKTYNEVRKPNSMHYDWKFHGSVYRTKNDFE